jgi:hypothetical protein
VALLVEVNKKEAKRKHLTYQGSRPRSNRDEIR